MTPNDAHFIAGLLIHFFGLMFGTFGGVYFVVLAFRRLSGT